LKTIPDNQPTVLCIQLASFRSATDCDEALKVAMNGRCRVLVIAAHMKLCTASMVTAARRIIDMTLSSLRAQWDTSETFDPLSFPRVIFLLHMPASYLVSQPCYQNVPLNDWCYTYIDCFDDGDEVAATAVPQASQSANYDPSTDNTSSQYGGMRRWLQVAYSLRGSLSANETELEFSHLLEVSLSNAFRSCEFKQKLTPSRQGKMNLIWAGLPNTLSIYQNNDRTNATTIIISRNYLTKALLLCFSAVWTNLLSTTIEFVSKRLCEGSSCRGLVASIRSNHQWLFSDFLKELVRNHIAVHWGLESFARLPVDVDFDSSCLDSVGIVGRVSGAESSQFGIVALTVHVLQAVAVDLAIQNRSSSISTNTMVDCGKYDSPTKLPLYHSMIYLMDIVKKIALTKSRSKDQPTVSQGDWDLKCYREVLSTSQRFSRLAHAIAIVESRQEICDQWKSDFIKVFLGFSDHNEKELRILQQITSAFVKEESRDGDYELEDLIGASAGVCGDICAWFLNQTQIRAYLSDYSKLLFLARRIDVVIEDENIKIDESLEVQLISMAIEQLWKHFSTAVNLTTLDPLNQWIEGMSDFMALSFVSLNRLHQETTIIQTDITKFGFMTIFFKYATTVEFMAPLQRLNVEDELFRFNYRDQSYTVPADNYVVSVYTLLSLIDYPNAIVER
jgi:hypothetical protein